ncbi:uncharacterized protein LDX57_002737 [Aspergillus melleus]|uniref:uncharacterized protein n=1 Tax=Aspergillus melleus TaxID=138277 RepID=UPI001E8D5E0D|nr:uncharacterized protein LDX57_002737 [Aspergillus melleus]KAH8424991.1 hypothetical protein LDX57_002737 [Aspergillus melleus]
MRLSTVFTVAATAQSAMGCTFVFWLTQEASWGGTNGVSHLARIWESDDPDFKGTADASVDIGFQGGCNNVGYKGQTYEFCFERAANHDLHGPATVRRTNNGGGTKRNIHPDGQEYRDVWSVGLGSVDIHAYYVTGIECPSS